MTGSADTGGGAGPGSAYQAAIEAIYDAVAREDAWPRALQAIADCFGDVGTIMIYAGDDGTVGSIVSPSLIDAQEAHMAGGWVRRDLRFERADERGYFSTIDAITDRHIATDREMASHPYYQDFLKSQGLRWFGGVAVSPRPGVKVALSVQRSARKPAFSDAELEQLVVISRHVEKALRFSYSLISAERLKSALSDILDRLRVGVFLLDGDDAVVFRNEAAAALLGSEMTVLSGRLSLSDFGKNQILREEISAARLGPSAVAGRPTQPIVIPRTSGTGFYAAYAIPAGSPLLTPVDDLMSGVRSIVVVTSSEAGQMVDPTIVRDLLGLTLGEAKVAAHVAAGLPVKDTSDRLGISENTAKTHLKRVFKKAKVTKQSELKTLLDRITLDRR